MIDSKRFRKVQGYIYDNEGEDDGLLDLTGIEDMLNILHEENIELKNKRWKIMELIIEYDATNKYTEKDVIDKIKDILNLVMVG